MIIDPDNYNYVQDVYQSPYCKAVIIALKFIYNGITHYSQGTGFMVGDKVILTAGHVIWHTTFNIQPTEIRIYLRYSETKTDSTALFNDSGYYHPKSWVLSSNFARDEENYNYDWCYLTAWESIGYTYTGFFGIGTTTNDISEPTMYVTGYPNVAGRRYYQYWSSGSLDSISDYRVQHTCSTEGGHSGAPIYSNNYVVWSIHTSHGTSMNYGVRITRTLYDLIINKRAETET